MKYLLHIISIVSVMAFVNSCTQSNSEKATASDSQASQLIQVTKTQFENAGMALDEIHETHFYASVNCNGYIQVKPGNEASVSIPIGGLLSEINVSIGSWVNKGDVLFKFENMELLQLQQDYLEAVAQLDYLHENYMRQETYQNEKMSSEKELLKAKSEYFVMKAKYLGLQNKLALINISTQDLEKGSMQKYGLMVAPVSGYVTQLNYTIGGFINPGAIVLEIINNNQLQLCLNVFERDVLKLQKNQEVKFTLPELSPTSFDAMVKVIGSEISDDNGSIPVYCPIKPNKNVRFIPGMYVDASVRLNHERKKSWPESAVIAFNNQHFVLSLNKFENDIYYFDKVAVETGASYNNKIELLNNKFSAQTKILTKGAFNLILDSE